ncbi:MAG: cytochrome c oxidase accessory protein CcoG [Planctomycetes bacterium]|nr:cytochrome c oxidase accessory protein CcoG [Planctomycetota bacterium]
MSTMRDDGSRRWMHPRVSSGRFWRARRLVAYVLIAVFTVTPYVRVGGEPAILLNLRAREFTILGFTFLPTDTLLLALLLVSAVVGIAFVTALFGRVWCGWACPQTVYMEFVYRPFERLFDGLPGPHHAPGQRATVWRRLLKVAVFLAVSAYLAHTFLAYFVGVESLARWVRQSPVAHPTAFLVMAAATALMMFDFCYFREQTCLVACPYGRFQSVMLDRDSLIVSYDPRRGEPRGKGKRLPGDNRGDCIDCGACTDTCPTGIDIRDGLQMECVACTQCIDACDRVMDRIDKPRGLIRFSSQSRMEGDRPGRPRPRVIAYPAIIVVLLIAFGIVLAGKQPADVTLLRGLGRPFTETTPGMVTNQVRVKIANRGRVAARYSLDVADATRATLTAAEMPFLVEAGQSRTEPVSITVPAGLFTNGRRDIRLRVSDGAGFSQVLTYRLLGPFGRSGESHGTPAVEEKPDE